MSAVSVAFPSQAILGECPVWSRSRNRLLWVDTLAPTLNMFDPVANKNVALPMPSPIGFVAENFAGELIVGIGCDIGRVDDAGSVSIVATAPHARAGFRLNDARFDSQGRLWVGLMDEELSEESGYLYCFDPDGTWHECDRGFTLVNGLDWSRDERTLYVTDSRKGNIYAYDYDPASGEIGDRQLLVYIDPNKGKPDGLTVDFEGFLLSVLFDGGAIIRIDPDGNIYSTIELPVPRPTSCAYSSDGRQLYVTSARLGLTDDELEAFPISGALLRLDCGKI